MTLRIREDLFQNNRNEVKYQENIQEGINIYVCPSTKQEEIKFVKVSMKKKSKIAKLRENRMKRESDKKEDVIPVLEK